MKIRICRSQLTYNISNSIPVCFVQFYTSFFYIYVRPMQYVLASIMHSCIRICTHVRIHKCIFFFFFIRFQYCSENGGLVAISPKGCNLEDCMLCRHAGWPVVILRLEFVSFFFFTLFFFCISTRKLLMHFTRTNRLLFSSGKLRRWPVVIWLIVLSRKVLLVCLFFCLSREFIFLNTSLGWISFAIAENCAYMDDIGFLNGLKRFFFCSPLCGCSLSYIFVVNSYIIWSEYCTKSGVEFRVCS